MQKRRAGASIGWCTEAAAITHWPPLLPPSSFFTELFVQPLGQFAKAPRRIAQAKVFSLELRDSPFHLLVRRDLAG